MTSEIGAKEEAVITLKGARSGDVALRQNGKQNQTLALGEGARLLRELRKLGRRGRQGQDSLGQESGFYHHCDKDSGVSAGKGHDIITL